MHERFASFAPLFVAFGDAGFQLFVVGGCVRDVVLGLERIGDVDLATDARPDDTVRVLQQNGFKAYPIGERFGTITTVVAGATVEITTFRVGEVYERGSRHPRVEFGTDLRADLSRRDLSMNAMAMAADGTIIDPFDGQTAIAARVLEVPGGGYDNTISILRDDPLRLLRIARFAARFGYAPTEDTTRAARVTAPELIHISHERWKMEMDKLLVGVSVRTGLEWLHEVGALDVVLPRAAGSSDAQVARLGHRLAAAPAEVATRWAIALMSCLHRGAWFDGPRDTDAAALVDAANELAARMRFSNREKRALAALVAFCPTREALQRPWSEPELRRFYVDAPDEAGARLDVQRALADGDPAVLDACDRIAAALERVLADGDPTPRLPSGFGTQLRRHLALDGRRLGDAIQRVRDGILDGEIDNDASAERYVAFLRDVLPDTTAGDDGGGGHEPSDTPN